MANNKNQKKKAIKQMQKQNRERNKEKANIIREVIELPSLDLDLARKEQGEKSYTILLLKQIIEKCDEVIKTEQTTVVDSQLLEWIRELDEISKSEYWYYYQKIKELNLSENNLKTIELLRNTPKRYLANWNRYSLNIIERSIIHMEVYTLLLYWCVLGEHWGEEEWKFTRINIMVSLHMLLEGLEQCTIKKVEVHCDNSENVKGVKCTYGARFTNDKNMSIERITQSIFENQVWIWKRCNDENKVIRSGESFEIVLNLTRKWKGLNVERLSSLQQANNNSTDYVSILEQGVKLKHKGKYEEAKEMYIKAINIDNTHPNGYYNLGKILYILGKYEASAKAYKAAYERGICELMRSKQLQNNIRSDSNSFYVHLGHALIDIQNVEGRYSEYVRQYQDGVDPSRVKGYIVNRGQIRTKGYHDYDKICVEAAREYLEGNN